MGITDPVMTENNFLTFEMDTCTETNKLYMGVEISSFLISEQNDRSVISQIQRKHWKSLHAGCY